MLIAVYPPPGHRLDSALSSPLFLTDSNLHSHNTIQSEQVSVFIVFSLIDLTINTVWSLCRTRRSFAELHRNWQYSSKNVRDQRTPMRFAGRKVEPGSFRTFWTKFLDAFHMANYDLIKRPIRKRKRLPDFMTSLNNVRFLDVSKSFNIYRVRYFTRYKTSRSNPGDSHRANATSKLNGCDVRFRKLIFLLIDFFIKHCFWIKFWSNFFNFRAVEETGWLPEKHWLWKVFNSKLLVKSFNPKNQKVLRETLSV